MASAAVVCVGSFMMDLVVTAQRRPAVGETLVGESFGSFPGGKGFNQCVAAARMGVPSAMVGMLGDDGFGRTFAATMRDEGIANHALINAAGLATGVGSIVVDPQGNNSIIIVPGANAALSPADVEAAADVISGARVLLLQLELPVPVVVKAAQVARENKTRVVFNPAPAPSEGRELPGDIWAACDVVIVNEIEVEQITGTPAVDQASAEKGAKQLLQLGVSETAIVTLGEQGCVAVSADGTRALPAAPISKCVDSTAAGDAFCGALAAAIAGGMDTFAALEFANAAGGLAVTKQGAVPSLPRRSEVEGLVGKAFGK